MSGPGAHRSARADCILSMSALAVSVVVLIIWLLVALA
jgi:hypothetical protein